MAEETPLACEQPTTVCIQRLEYNVEPAFIQRMLHGFRDEDILEIECPTCSQTAYVTFKDRAQAEAAVNQFDNAQSDVRGHRLQASIKNSHVTNENNLLLSTFLRDEEARKDVKSNTVRVEGLPRAHTLRSLGQLLDDDFFHARGGAFCEPGDEYVEPQIGIPKDETGVAYLQFENSADGDADTFVFCYNGSYWKNNVLYAYFVPDIEFEERFPRRKEGKHVGFWVGNLKAGIASEEMTEMFKPFPLQTVNIPSSSNPGTSFAFVFMRQDDAAGFISLHPRGFKHQRRWIKVRPMKQKGVAVAPTPSQITSNSTPTNTSVPSLPNRQPANVVPKNVVLPPGPTDVKVENLSYSAKKPDVRDLFNGFEVSKVIVKKGYAFVGLPTLKDAQSAESRLSGRKLLGRTVSVKVMGQPPSHV